MTEYVCEQLTNATYKCSELVVESSGMPTWLLFVLVFFIVFSGSLLLFALMDAY